MKCTDLQRLPTLLLLAAVGLLPPLGLAQAPVFTQNSFGGSAIDAAGAVAIDADGNIYVVGSTNSTNFPTPNGFQTNFGGTIDAFVTKLDPTGQTILASTYLGGSGDDRATGVAIDADGNVVVTGNTASNDFPTTNDALQGGFGGGASDAFLARLSSDLDQLLDQSPAG